MIIRSNGESEILFASKELVAEACIPERGLTELDRLSYVVN